MANTILSSGVRNNLLTLQKTTSEQAVLQNRLATGRKVNSAIDNPVNYFTAQSLNDRGSQLTGLLDGISNGIQTIQAASKGIDGITKLVQSLQSTVKQAQADAAQNRPTVVGTGTALSSTAETQATNKSLKDIALDKRVGSAGDTTVTTATAGSAGDLGIDVTATPALNIQITTGPVGAPTSTTNNSARSRALPSAISDRSGTDAAPRTRRSSSQPRKPQTSSIFGSPWRASA